MMQIHEAVKRALRGEDHEDNELKLAAVILASEYTQQKKEIDRLRALATNQATAIDGLVRAAKGTPEWGSHLVGCWGHDNECDDDECDCGHDVLHEAVQAVKEAMG